MADALKTQLPDFFEKMDHSDDDGWAKQDSKSSYRIYGYGHALAALNLLHESLYPLGLRKFLKLISESHERSREKITPAFAFEPTRTWVPALFELAFALRAIRLNFDPFEYQTKQQVEREADINAELEAERHRISRESQELAIRQKVLDEWEKEVIKQKRVAYDLRSIKDQVVSDLAAEHKMIPAAVADELRITFGRHFRFLLWAIVAIAVLMTRWAINGTQSASKMDGLITASGFAGFVLLEVILKQKTKAKP